jgi:transcriptional regulator with XRE-family HTH domain
MAFGRAVRQRRRLLDLSQQALAVRAGLSFRHIGEIERGNGDPRLSTVLKLLEALDVRPDELERFFGEGNDAASRR